MKFKVDENLPAEVAQLLGSAQHDAATIAEQGMSGARDQQVVRVCANERRVLVTLDLDFANVTAYPPQDYPGFIVLRLRRQDTRTVLEALQRVIPLLDEDRLEGRLWIVEEARIRIRSQEKD